MHVLLCVGDDAESLAPALAAAWRGAAPRCDVRTVVVPGAAPAPEGAPDPAASGATGVFVPLGSLGLASVAPAGPGPLDAPAGDADLVVVHVPVLGSAALREGPVAKAVRAAAPHAVPVVVLAGRDETSRREWSGAGVSGVHEVGDDVAAATARVARTWAPSWA